MVHEQQMRNGVLTLRSSPTARERAQAIMAEHEFDVFLLEPANAVRDFSGFDSQFWESRHVPPGCSRTVPFSHSEKSGVPDRAVDIGTHLAAMGRMTAPRCSPAS